MREVKPEQSMKARSPMFVTELGRVIEVKSDQFRKASSPILSIVLGILVFLHPAISVLVEVSIIALQLSRES